MDAHESTPRRGKEGSGRIVPENRTRSYCELGEAIDALERVDWREVPTLTTSEASALHARLREARDELGTEMSPRPAGEGL